MSSSASSTASSSAASTSAASDGGGDTPQHACVRAGLAAFVDAHIPGADLSCVDEIVLAYIVSVLEEASTDPCFDVDGFAEMMCAYIPAFASIAPATICSWIFQLEAELSELNAEAREAAAAEVTLRSLSLCDIVAPAVTETAAVTATVAAAAGGPPGRRVQHLSETSDGGSTDSSVGCLADFFTEECDQLQEMFPDSSALEVKHCVSIANGDIDRATQTLLDRQDAGQSLQTNQASLHAPKSLRIDENELKSRIISRYSYVDKNAETKEYKPVGPKVEPKKLVRYRDNKIVSLKGERYTDVRRDDDAELKKPKRPICP